LSGNFDTQAGYTVLEKGNLRVVLYRADRMQALEGYIKKNIDDRFQMRRERVNTDLGYVDFVEKFRLPARTLQALHGDAIFSHFYDRHEAAQLAATYLEAATPPAMD
jgi:hypothetical protein